MRKINILVLMLACIIFTSISCFGGGGKGGSGSSGPTYFSFEDLRSGIRNEYFYFENQSKPDNAMLWLEPYMQYPLCASRNAVIMKKVTANPTLYKIDTSMHIMANWNDVTETPVDWNAISSTVTRGDLIFTRSNSKAGNLVKFFSNWTHVAIMDDTQRKYVFESTPDSGVSVNDGPATWKNITYYTCKTIETIPWSQRCYFLDQGKQKFTKLPYYPKESTAIGRARFIFDWSNKDNLSSMYCSKLVYNVYRSCISLDTGRTSVFNPALQDKAWGANVFSWIGVSPDDIYYSSSLGRDFTYSQNLIYL